MKAMKPTTLLASRTLQGPIRVTGKELELERRSLDVKVSDLATAMGRAPSRVSQIEAQRYVTPRMAQRYREALATFATVATTEAA